MVDLVACGGCMDGSRCSCLVDLVACSGCMDRGAEWCESPLASAFAILYSVFTFFIVYTAYWIAIALLPAVDELLLIFF